MQSNRVISDDGLSAVPSGYRIDIRLPWYRSLPLSTVEVGEVAFDGKAVDPAMIRFELEGHSYSLANMPELTDKVWFVLDSAYLNVSGPALPTGSEHSVSVTLNLYPPYIRGLKRVSRETKTLRASP